MQKLNEGLDRLRSCIPQNFHLYHRRLSKIRTLRLAMSYIATLTKMLNKDSGLTSGVCPRRGNPLGVSTPPHPAYPGPHPGLTLPERLNAVHSHGMERSSPVYMFNADFPIPAHDDRLSGGFPNFTIPTQNHLSPVLYTSTPVQSRRYPSFSMTSALDSSSSYGQTDGSFLSTGSANCSNIMSDQSYSGPVVNAIPSPYTYPALARMGTDNTAASQFYPGEYS